MKNGASAPILDPDPGVKDVAMVPSNEAPSDTSGLALVIQKLAENPNVDVDKLERIIALQKDIARLNAKAAFDAAFSRMQADMPVIDEHGKILNKSKAVQSTYAKLEDIHAAVKPVLKTHGFAIRHRTEWPEGKFGGPDGKTSIIRVVGILSHEQGHSEESAFEAPMDRSDFRSDIQSMGSTVSYGRRYTTLDLLNIATRGVDDDGATAGRPQPAEGYERAWEMLVKVADGGTKTLDDAWGQCPPDFKTYTVNHNKQALNELRAKAAGVTASKAGRR